MLYHPITIARPYAKAILDFALEHNNVKKWQSMLQFSAELSHSNFMLKLFSSMITPKKLANIFIDICEDHLDLYGKNLIHIMAMKKRLLILPVVLNYFNYLYNLKKSVIEIEVVSSFILTKSQLVKIITAIEKKFLKKVKCNFNIDKSILAGIIIRIDNQIINYSVINHLKDLEKFLIF